MRFIFHGVCWVICKDVAFDVWIVNVIVIMKNGFDSRRTVFQ